MTNAEKILARMLERQSELGLKERAVGVKAGSAEMLRTVRRNVRAGKTRDISMRVVKALAGALETTPEWLMQDIVGTLTPEDCAPLPQRTFETKAEPAALDAFARDLPVIGTAAGSIIGDVAGMRLRTPASRYIARPPTLEGIANAYALEVTGLSMEPMLRAGDICVVDPNATPKKGDLVVVQTQHYDADPGQAYVKILQDRSGPYLNLLQLNPVASLRIPREYVASVHRVMTTRDILDT